MNGVERTLLQYLDLPVVIGDPAGSAVWANPAFETRFGASGEDLLGQPLAELFGGGSRERVLNAVALVCAGGESERFRLREHGADYEAVVSGIEVGAECVGVVILLKETVEHLERLIGLQRQLQEPLDDIELALDALLEQTGGRRSERHRRQVEDALRGLSRVRKWSEELGALLSGDGAAPAERFDPVAALRRVAAGLVAEGQGPPVDVLAPMALPAVQGDPARLEWALGRMIAARRCAGARGLVLGARPLPGAVLVSLTESADGPLRVPEADDPDVREVWAMLRAEVHTVSDAKLGRVTLARIPAAPAAG